jgi:hypothetical protein
VVREYLQECLIYFLCLVKVTAVLKDKSELVIGVDIFPVLFDGLPVRTDGPLFKIKGLKEESLQRMPVL